MRSADVPESSAESGSTLLRQLAHELRDALSPLASSADVARLRNFDPEASRLLAEKVERSLRRALVILDTFVLGEQCENGTLQLAMSRIPLGQVVQTAREALRAQGIAEEQLPSPSTMAEVLNRMGYRLRKVLNAKPQKKIKETDAIFDNIKKKPTRQRTRSRSNA